MSIGLFFASAFLAWGPPTAFIIFTVIPYPFMMIAALGSSLFALFAFFCSSVFWLAFDKLQDASVYALSWLVYPVFIELFRYFCYKIYLRLRVNYSVMSSNVVTSPTHDYHFALSLGLSFGLTQALILYGNTIVQSFGEGALFPSDSACEEGFSTVISAAVVSLTTVAVNVALTYLLLLAQACRTVWMRLILWFSAVVSHFFVMFATMAPIATNWCEGGVVLNVVLTAVVYLWLAVVAYRVPRMQGYDRLEQHED